jgi:MYXO-CTERM domain-containing protein
MFPALVGILYLPVLVWIGTAVGLYLALRRSAPSLVLRLAATFCALWALLATTVAIWVLSNGGWVAVVRLAYAPLELFQWRWALLWAEGAVGAFLVFLVAFLLNQAVGRGFLGLLHPRELAWPAGLSRPAAPMTLLAYDSPRAEAFSFTLLERGGGWLGVRRREVILLSRALLRRLDADEREAAIAHEVGHLIDLDGRYLTFFRTLARLMRWDPVLAYLAYSITRREEFRADAEAVRLTRRPLALARALYKVSVDPASGPGPVATVGFLGAGSRRRQRETLERIRRLVALAESGLYAEGSGASR